MAWIYGPVNSIDDIARINCIIRDEMLGADTAEQLTELKKRSDYLCTLSYSPFWKKKFGKKIEALRQEAVRQNRLTVKLANIIAKVKGWSKHYSPWGKNHYSDFENHLKMLVEQLLSDIEQSIYEDKTQIEVDIRKLFCQIRFSMILSETEEQLITLLKKAKLWVFTTFGKILLLFFEKNLIEKLRKMVIEEYNLTATLGNFIAQYYGWEIEFEPFNESDVEQEEDIEEYLERLDEEIQKASSYIPSEYKYQKGAKVIWIVYNSKGKKKAKRIYLPIDAEDIHFDGPAWYTTRFGRRVWGLKITYKKTIGPRVIKRGDMVIEVGPTKVKRSKIVELPEEVNHYEVREEKPVEAMKIW